MSEVVTCRECGKRREKVGVPYDYTQLAGLDPKHHTILLYGIDVFRCDCGLSAQIPNVNGLHAVIVRAFLEGDAPLTASAYRFIRKTLGMTQKQFAELVDRTPVTISKWENKGPWPEGANEVAVRALVLSAMLDDPDMEKTLETGAVRAIARSLRAKLEDHHDPFRTELCMSHPFWKIRGDDEARRNDGER